MTPTVPVMLITGPVGVGKTTVASEVSELLDAAGVAHGLVDVDALRWCYPRHPGDRFRIGLAMKNLAAVWGNFREYGAERLVLADVVESREELQRYREAIPGAEILVVRLRASPETLAARLRVRELGMALDRHLRRASELADLMECNRVEDILVDTDGKGAPECARVILSFSEWERS
ncbi:MAG: AAA family ATPase [Chloroflexota bacterium]|nr:AAA family ATPase [Chloroflexota bacterium]